MASDDEISTNVPAALLLRVLHETWDPLEVKVVLAAAALGGSASPVREEIVVAHEALDRGTRLDGSVRDRHERVGEAVERAVARGTLLRFADEQGEHWLILGTEDNRRQARNGLIVATDAPGGAHTVLRQERPNVFALYEQNIGLVTPIIADCLVEALDLYPEHWVRDAIGEAVGYNKRSWRYIQRILQNWAAEGRGNEAHRGTATRDLDREKHLRGKYAGVFRRDGR